MQAPPRTAWIVDDEAVNRALASAFLQRLGWSTREMDGGHAVLEAAREGLPQLLVVDIRMPRLSGPELVARLRERFDLGATCVLAYTAHCLREEVDGLRQSGFDRVLLKPVSFQDMKDAVDGCCTAGD
jgi:CheY-like chemotaxis protein